MERCGSEDSIDHVTEKSGVICANDLLECTDMSPFSSGKVRVEAKTKGDTSSSDCFTGEQSRGAVQCRQTSQPLKTKRTSSSPSQLSILNYIPTSSDATTINSVRKSSELNLDPNRPHVTNATDSDWLVSDEDLLEALIKTERSLSAPPVSSTLPSRAPSRESRARPYPTGKTYKNPKHYYSQCPPYKWIPGQQSVHNTGCYSHHIDIEVHSKLY